MGAFLRMIFSFIAAQAIMGSLRKLCEREPEVVEPPSIVIEPPRQPGNVQPAWEPPSLPGQLPVVDEITVTAHRAPHPDVLNQIRVIEDKQP